MPVYPGAPSVPLLGLGTRFVWYTGGAQQKDVVEGALVHYVEASFVALNHGEFREGGEVAEGGRDAPSGFGGKTIPEEAVLNGPVAAQAPVGGGHFLDHAELDAIARAEMFDVLREESLESLARFALEDHAIGQKPVLESVLPRPALALGSFGAMGAGPIGARSSARV
jgi:hypothetical protein